VNWSVSADGGSYILEWRYANGSGNSRSASVTVNGSVVATVDFASTGSWTSWTSASVNVSLS